VRLRAGHIQGLLFPVCLAVLQSRPGDALKKYLLKPPLECLGLRGIAFWGVAIPYPPFRERCIHFLPGILLCRRRVNTTTVVVNRKGVVLTTGPIALAVINDHVHPHRQSGLIDIHILPLMRDQENPTRCTVRREVRPEW